MWSRKPIPVSMLICCDFEDWEACSFASPLVSLPWVEVEGKEPPSRFSASCILVSFVSRLSVVLRVRASAMIPAICSKSLWAFVSWCSRFVLYGGRECVFNGLSEKLESEVAVMQGSDLAPTLISRYQNL